MRKNGWCSCPTGLINLDELNYAEVINMGTHDSLECAWGLFVFFSRSNKSILMDSYRGSESEEEVESTKLWLLKLLNFQITRVQWDEGRHDESLRKGGDNE